MPRTLGLLNNAKLRQASVDYSNDVANFCLLII